MPLVSLVAVIPPEHRSRHEPAPIAAYTHWSLAFEIPGVGTQIWLRNLDRYVTVRDIAVVNSRFFYEGKLVELEFDVERKELDWLVCSGWRVD